MPSTENSPTIISHSARHLSICDGVPNCGQLIEVAADCSFRCCRAEYDVTPYNNKRVRQNKDGRRRHLCPSVVTLCTTTQTAYLFKQGTQCKEPYQQKARASRSGRRTSNTLGPRCAAVACAEQQHRHTRFVRQPQQQHKGAFCKHIFLCDCYLF